MIPDITYPNLGIQERVIHQYAWLDFHGGFWHLLTNNSRDHRKWTNRHQAFSDLIFEGWAISGNDGKEPTVNHDADRHLYGYGLIRTVH
jgi:hypothetical protein